MDVDGVDSAIDVENPSEEGSKYSDSANVYVVNAIIDESLDIAK